MNTSLSWIKAYVPELDVTAQEYTDAMTLSGTKVEGYEILDADLDKIVIGQIDKIEKHPDADKPHCIEWYSWWWSRLCRTGKSIQNS